MKVILLVGAPRCGKTQLALQMCQNKRSVFYDVRSSSLKSFLEHIDTNVDVMVFDDIPEWQLQHFIITANPLLQILYQLHLISLKKNW